jgi:hypothetical protein
MDEIDAHMHPAWQQSLLARLRALLPNVQIIASTHSPLVVAGLDVQEMTRFDRDADGAVVQVPIDRDMTVGRADQILTGDLFGLESTLALGDATDRRLREYEELLGMPDRTPVQERRYARLHRVLAERIPPAGAETKLERRSQQLVQAVLDIDFAGEQHDEQRRKLFEKVSAVARSMGWLELAGDRPAEPR